MEDIGHLCRVDSLSPSSCKFQESNLDCQAWVAITLVTEPVLLVLHPASLDADLSW